MPAPPNAPTALSVSPPAELPTRGVGSYGPVTLKRYDEQTGDVSETVRFEGRIIGSASSEKDTHIGHPRTDWAPKHVKCSACRWLEATIYKRRIVDPVMKIDGLAKSDNLRCRYDYVIYTVGVSNVPGEIDFIRLHQTSSAFEVVELLTVRRYNRITGKTDAFLPPQHAQALAQAASIDEDVSEAYVNRAVA